MSYGSVKRATVQIQTHGYGAMLVSFRKIAKKPELHVTEKLVCLKQANQIKFGKTVSLYT
jgi:hypothetical protein